MGNISSSGGNGRRRNSRRRNQTESPPPQQPPPPPPPPSLPPPAPSTEISANRIVFAAATPYPNLNPNQFYQQYPTGYYRPPPGTMPVPSPYDHYPPPPPHYHHPLPWTTGGRYPYGGPTMPQPTPYVEHQKAVTIRNDVNLKKETLKLEPDLDNPGRFLVSFTFDATVSGR